MIKRILKAVVRTILDEEMTLIRDIFSSQSTSIEDRLDKEVKVIKKDRFGEWERISKKWNMWQGHRCKKN